MKDPQEITILTYNVRAWRGLDERHDHERTLDIIRRADPDIVALQEAAFASSSAEEHEVTPGLLEAALDMDTVVGATLARSGASFGNVLLSRLPIRAGWLHDISMHGRESRGVVEAVIDAEGRTVRCFNTHLGLRLWERGYQAARLDAMLTAQAADLTLLAGDFNEWIPWGRLHRHIRRWFGASPAVRSYPAQCPLVALDRIWARPASSLVSLCALSDARTRVASDHLPVIARVRLPDML